MPFELPVEVSGFGINLPWVKNGWRTEQFSTSDVIRAAIVAGYVFGGTAIHWRIQAWRLASIRLALDVPPGSTTPLMGQLSHPRAWTDLDLSEKGSVNSLLGNVITKLLCERILYAPRIWFLSLYGQRMNASFAGPKRPDFFTMTSAGDWISLEAKGRSYRPPSRLLTAAKNQASALHKINGKKIAAHVVSWSMSKNGRVCARFHDPEPSERGSNLREQPFAEGLGTVRIQIFGRYSFCIHRLFIGPGSPFSAVGQESKRTFGFLKFGQPAPLFRALMTEVSSPSEVACARVIRA